MTDADHTTEATPLLAKPPAPTPLPKRQLAIILLLQLAEPMSCTIIYPFINQMITDLDITGGDETKVGYYVGLMMSLFFMVQAVTVLQWSRLSDRVGRKPVILTGLIGITLSMLLIGLSQSFWMLVVARCIQGFMNGNSGVLKSVIGEITDSTNMVQAFALLPVVWATGATVAPMLGGLLQHPHERFPAYFGHPFWAKNPYFLPCFVAATFSLFCLVIAFCFLDEHVRPGSPASKNAALTPSSSTDTLAQSPARSKLRPSPSEATFVTSDPPSSPKMEKPPTLRESFTPRVLLAVANYGFLAMIEIMLGALEPLMFSSPVKLGGLGWSPQAIGIALGGFGLANGLFQATLFPRIVRRCGLKNVYVTGVVAFVPMILALPFANFAARSGAGKAMVGAIVALLFAMNVVMEMAFASVFVYVSSSAASRNSLGATNGAAQTIASIARAVGPFAATSLFAFSIGHNVFGGHLVYAALLLLVCGALGLASRLPKKAWEREEDES